MEQNMKKITVPLMLVLAIVTQLHAQTINFSGNWKMDKIDPPADPRNGRPPGSGGGAGGGGDVNNEYGASIRDLFTQAPASLVITQTASEMTVRVGNEKTAYTLDDKMMVVPAGDVNALKTHAHWDGQKLHLHFKKGMNWGRDILSIEGGKLVMLRDVESGGASTTFKITYSKQ
jgi:hypothetical protein